MARYHHAAYTLDADNPVGDEPPPAVGHDEEQAEAVKEASDANVEATKGAAEAQARADQEWAERDPKPTPSELLAERGHEPAPEESGQAKGEGKGGARAKGEKK